MKKIRSGQVYLYRDGGIQSTVFEIRMKEMIRGDILRRALESTYVRYPYFKSKLVEKDGDFYVVENLLSVAFAKTDKFRALGSMSVNYHLIDVTYTDKKIRVAFHHALCDGRGLKPFLETLIYYYCCQKYNKNFDSTGIRLADQELLPGEMAEPFGETKYTVGDTPMPNIIRDGYVLPEHNMDEINLCRFEINIEKESLMKVCKTNDATPAILISLLAQKAIKNIHPEVEKPVLCNMAYDMRKELQVENTYKNCVGSLYLPYLETVENLPLLEQAKIYRNVIKEQRQPDVVKTSANGQIGISDRLDQMSGLNEKQKMLSFFKDICINTFVLSYVGQFQLGEWDKYVDSIHLYSSSARGLILNMIATGNVFTIDFLQSFESDKLVKEFIKVLGENEIEYKISDKMENNTTCDKTYATGKWQAERFYEKQNR